MYSVKVLSAVAIFHLLETRALIDNDFVFSLWFLKSMLVSLQFLYNLVFTYLKETLEFLINFKKLASI